MTKPRTLSASSIATFRQCPRKWEFRYIKKIPELPGLEAVLGNFIHGVLEKLMQLPPAERTFESARKIAREDYDTKIITSKNYKSFGLDDSSARKFRLDAWASIEGVWGLEDPTLVDVYSTEMRVTTKIGEVDFLSYIDRVDKTDEGFVIVDYKTGKFPTKPNLQEEKLEQLRLYAAAFEAAEGVRPSEVRLYFPNPSNLDAGDQISEAVEEECQQATIQKLNEVSVEIKSATEAEDFPARAGPLCGWCSYVESCEEGKAEIKKRYYGDRIRADAPAVALLNLSPA